MRYEAINKHETLNKCGFDGTEKLLTNKTLFHKVLTF